MYKNFYLLLPVLLVLITGCAQNEAGAKESDYDETKKMVVDILKTDDGKKAIQEVMSDDAMKQQLVMDQTVVSDTIEKTLVSDKGTEFWKKNLQDPKFAESVATSLRDEHEKLIKDLMKDPEYRGMMIEVLQDPEMEKAVTKILKSKEYREHLQKVMTETFESPLYQAKVQALLLKAAGEIKEGGGKEGGGS
ncbi:spore germination lipoprotein GerD [Bacillus sp. 31A1R]|uniref:Spore germination lipoprotein GerD n=1 Tax=Robertmurraya mangrovi TaxID=3098077 RepID=A0ABU5J5I3_9BACI|nr:spore germination lipoprotein GerD [Bacillus sp. 31A1R]MDZ5474679.1 spore germination lipoprotein GerD [Bacillus sp. 31A1R]